MSEALRRLGWSEKELSGRAKGHPGKLLIARRLRQETTMSLKWIAAWLRMGTWTYLSKLLNLKMTHAMALQVPLLKDTAFRGGLPRRPFGFPHQGHGMNRRRGRMQQKPDDMFRPPVVSETVPPSVKGHFPGSQAPAQSIPG